MQSYQLRLLRINSSTSTRLLILTSTSDVDLLAADNDDTLTHQEFLGQVASQTAKKVTTRVNDNSLKDSLVNNKSDSKILFVDRVQ